MVQFCSAKCTSSARLDGMTAVITGCNTGIGKVTALDFCRRGGRVIMACRSVEKAEKTREDILEELKDVENAGVIVVKRLDLGSLKSIRQCAQELLDDGERIDILVNNAGVMACPKSFTEDGFEMQFGTNHLGHFLFTLLLLPRILHCAPARIINVSSSLHMAGNMDLDDLNYSTHDYSPVAAYGRSKAANILFTKELARRLEGRNVNVYALHPGAVDTELQRHVDDVFFPGMRFLYRKVFSWTVKSPEQGAQTTLHCALDEKAGQETGLYYSGCKVATPSGKVRNMETAQKLWKVSEELVKLGDFDPFTADDNGPKAKV